MRSWNRTRVWHDNETLFRQAIVDSPRSYRAYFLLGTWDVHHKRKRLGESELKEGMRLFPYDPYMAFNLAEAYREAGMCAAALPLYRWSREVEPERERPHGVRLVLDEPGTVRRVEGNGAGGGSSRRPRFAAAPDHRLRRRGDGERA